MSSSNDKKIRKTLLTPCRRVGLKRKSMSSTPNTSYDFSDFRSPCTPNTAENTSSSDVDTMNTTPVRYRIEKSITPSLKKRLKVRPAVADVSTPEPRQEDVSIISNVEEKRDKSIDADCKEDQENSMDYDEDQENNDIDSFIEKITKRISEKKAEIERLELDSKNVKQHDLAALNSLIKKWRLGCQIALKDLSHEYQNRDPNITLPVLLKQLGIPYELVHYSETDMDFQN